MPKIGLQGAGVVPFVDERVASLGWAKAPTGPCKARPDDKLRAVSTRRDGGTAVRVGSLRSAHSTLAASQA